MKFDFDNFSFQDEANFMNLNNQMQSQQIKANGTLGFNDDTIYDKIEKES
ncbi:MAG: hypothetical protein HFJ33_06565 [Clostridia bacterium]|nr:hypothetical protein [Clostridia bacterium]